MLFTFTASKKNEPLVRYRFSSQSVKAGNFVQGRTTYTVERCDDDAKDWQVFTMVKQEQGNIIVKGADMYQTNMIILPTAANQEDQAKSFEVAEVWLDAIAKKAGVDPALLVDDDRIAAVIALTVARERHEKRQMLEGRAKVIVSCAAAVVGLAFGFRGLIADSPPAAPTDQGASIGWDAHNSLSVKNSSNVTVHNSSNVTWGNATTGYVSNSTSSSAFSLSVGN